MKIGIVGAGRVAFALGKKWIKGGHEVIFGVRDSKSEKVKFLTEQLGDKTSFLSTKELFATNDIITLTVPFGAVEGILSQVGDISGKIIIDCTNAIPFAKEILKEKKFESGAEYIASLAKGAKVVKAFNSIGNNIMENTEFGEFLADAYICGDDKEANDIVAKLAENIGFDSIIVGDLSKARSLEHLAWLWITLSQKEGRNIAFKLLKK